MATVPDKVEQAAGGPDHTWDRLNRWRTVVRRRPGQSWSGVKQAKTGLDKIKQEAFCPDKVEQARWRPATDKIEQAMAGSDKGAAGPLSA